MTEPTEMPEPTEMREPTEVHEPAEVRERPRPGPELFGRQGHGDTGEARVDAAMALLHDLVGRPVAEQVAGYEEIHRALQDTLATVDDA